MAARAFDSNSVLNEEVMHVMRLSQLQPRAGHPARSRFSAEKSWSWEGFAMCVASKCNQERGETERRSAPAIGAECPSYILRRKRRACGAGGCRSARGRYRHADMSPGG